MFPKFFRGDEYYECSKKSFDSSLQFGSAKTTFICSDKHEKRHYYLLDDIVEVAMLSDELVSMYVKSKIMIDVFTLVVVRDPNTIKVLKKYIETAHMDTNMDLVTAISDVKEFIAHVSDMTRSSDNNVETKLKRQKVESNDGVEIV